MELELDFRIYEGINSHPSAEPEGNRRTIRLMSGSTSQAVRPLRHLICDTNPGVINVDALPPYNDTARRT